MTRNVCALWVLILLSPAFSPGSARAADPPKTESIRTVTMHLTPAPEPEHALKYRFETPYLEQEAGNAAFLYQIAVAQMMQTNSGDWAIDRETFRQWYSNPIETLPLEKLRPAVARFEQSFRLLEAAARREQCIWEYPVREEGFPYVSPLLNEYRTLSRLVVMKARLEAHDGNLEAAIDSLRCNVAMARGVGDGPNIIQHLVGIAMASETLRQVAELIQDPAAPNLYWALSTLPTPLVDGHRAKQVESNALEAEIPELRMLDDTVLSNERVTQLWNRVDEMLGSQADDPDRWLDKAKDIASMMEWYPRAKAYLIEQGCPAEEVEAWPALYVILRYQRDRLWAVRDKHFKWTYVPYAQAQDGLRETRREFARQDGYGNDRVLDNPFLRFFPAMQRVCFLEAKLERDMAMLRCVEAIRMYAADHEGTLPDSLDTITSVPVPLDTIYGRAFSYKVAGKKAVLESPVPPDGGPKDGLRYEITLR